MLNSKIKNTSYNYDRYFCIAVKVNNACGNNGHFKEKGFTPISLKFLYFNSKISNKYGRVIFQSTKWGLFDSLTHLFPMHPFSTPENIRKPCGFFMFLGGRERVHWERMG